MDPLSLTAAAIGIANSVTIVNQTFRLISSLKNAPTEFLDLQNEVNIYLKSSPQSQTHIISGFCLYSLPVLTAHTYLPLVGDNSRLSRRSAIDINVARCRAEPRPGGGGAHRTDAQLARGRRWDAARVLGYLPTERNRQGLQGSMETAEGSYRRPPG